MCKSRLLGTTNIKPLYEKCCILREYIDQDDTLNYMKMAYNFLMYEDDRIIRMNPNGMEKQIQESYKRWFHVTYAFRRWI